MKIVNVKYVNTCIKNAVLSVESNKKPIDPLVAGHIKWLYFQLTHTQMSEKQEDYIDNKIGSNQGWKILKCLQYVSKKNGIKDVC